MPVLALPNEYELVVTWKCNWRCEYCCVDTHNRPNITRDELKHKLTLIPDKCNVTLSGGEVGSLPRSTIEYIINRLEQKDCLIRLNTNGLFIRRYPDLLSRFEEVLYHCSENLNPDDEITIIPGAPNIEYLLIVTDNNYSKLADFLGKYEHIQFNLVAASNPDGINGPELSTELKHKMLATYYTRMTPDSIRRIFTEKNFDGITYI